MRAPIAVVAITLNEEHNIAAFCRNLCGWAQEVVIVDSYSQDNTVAIALSSGATVVQRRFRDFGDQWNFAASQLPIAAPWIMKLDPDERLSPELKCNLLSALDTDLHNGFSMDRRLWFMARPLPIRQSIVRVWRNGHCRFTNVNVNEHPVIVGSICHVAGEIEHHDSPNLDHWLEKQNRYTTAEAISAYKNAPLGDQPNLFGTKMQRRMWLKKHFHMLPGRFLLLFWYHFFLLGAWRAGWVGYVWARLRSDVMRLIEYKRWEIELTGRIPIKAHYGPGQPDGRVPQFD